MVIVEMASGHYLDYFGELYGVFRKAGEPDFSYRENILEEMKNIKQRSEEEIKAWLNEHIYD